MTQPDFTFLCFWEKRKDFRRQSRNKRKERTGPRIYGRKKAWRNSSAKGLQKESQENAQSFLKCLAAHVYDWYWRRTDFDFFLSQKRFYDLDFFLPHEVEVPSNRFIRYFLVIRDLILWKDKKNYDNNLHDT